MWRSLTIFFASASLLVSMGCANAYRGLRASTAEPGCLARWRPEISVAYYRVDAEIMGRSLNGILVMKRMEDSTIRMVYTNSMGPTYFDIGYKQGDGFTVNRIMEQLDQEAVVRTLEKDMKLVWMLGIPDNGSGTFVRDGMKYNLWEEGKDHYYYLTDLNCGRLLRAERASSRKTIVVAERFDVSGGMPDSVSLTHHNLAMTIRMKRFLHDTP